MSRKIERMHPELLEKYRQFDAQMAAAGIPFMITSVDRTIIEQMALYVQGRLGLHEVNKFRRAAGLFPLPTTENRIVTWTLESLHVTNPLDSSTENDKSRAFDIAILQGKKPTWDLKVSVNRNDIPDYQEAGAIWRGLGGTWGGDWSTPDYPHMQI